MEILGDSIDVGAKVSKVNIATADDWNQKAVSVEPKVLIMDDLTSRSNDQETESLLNFWNRLRKRRSIIYITAFQKSVVLLTVSRS